MPAFPAPLRPITVSALHLLVASISCAVLVLLLDDLSSINSQANCVALKALKIRCETKTTSERERGRVIERERELVLAITVAG